MADKIERRSFLKSSSTVALGLGIGKYLTGRESKPHGYVPAAAGRLPYKILYNQDDSAIFMKTDEPIRPQHVDKMVDQVADGGAHLLLACCNNQRVNYKSDVWESMWDEYRKHGTVYGRKSENWIKFAKQAMHLADQGCDYPGRVMQRCRERGIASGISIRMDDLHYRGPGAVGSNTVDKKIAAFYKNEDIYLLEPDRHGGRWAFDYEKQQVREYYMSLIREMVERYDMDVLDLDFMRHPPYFDRENLDRHCETMTGFLREIHALCHSSGRNISLMARVPATPANCHGLGLDVAAWAREGLVKGIALGMKYQSCWEAPVDAFRELVGTGVSIYPCTLNHAGGSTMLYLKEDGERTPYVSTRWNREMLRGFAAGHLANGADGIYLFNFFIGNLPLIDILEEMKSLEELHGKPKAYRVTTYASGTIAVEADLPMQVPVQVLTEQARKFEILMAAEPEDLRAEALVILDRRPEPSEIWLQMNERSAGHANRISEDPADLRYYSWHNFLDGTVAAVFSIPARVLRDGRNHLVFRNEGKALTVLGLAIRTL